MKTGKEGLIALNNRLSSTHQKASLGGLLAMPSSLDYAEKVRNWRLTNTLKLASQSRRISKDSGRKRRDREWLLSKVFSMNNEYLALLDRNGIKILGLGAY